MSRWLIAIAFYLAFTAVLLVWRPALMFRQDGAAKSWGAEMSENVSPFAPAFVLPFLAILSYYFAAVIQLASGSSTV